jgi:hypothetical protein
MKKVTLSIIRTGLAGFFDPVLQLFRSLSLKQLYLILLLFIPAVFLIVVTMAHYSRGPFYLQNVDPDYFYLYNSIIIGAGNLSIQYFAHPGTPLFFVIAIASRIIDVFQPGDYMENFVNDPEKYIHNAILFLNLLIVIVLYICGWLTLKYSGSLWAALLIQLSPFACFDLLSMSGRLKPEAMMMIPMLFLGLMVIKNAFEHENSRNASRDMVLYGLVIGFGMACKLTFLPVIILPLILLKTSLKQKFRYILYTILFFVIFAYPLFFNISEAWKWISGIFTHSGKYGTGEANIIDAAFIGKNLGIMFNYYSGFFYVILSSLVIVLVLLIPFVKKVLLPDMKIIRAVISILITVIVCIAAVIKHFELYYFIPFILFKFVLLLLIIVLILRLKYVSGVNAIKWSVMISSIIIISGILTIQVRQFRTIIAASEVKSKVMVEHASRMLAFIDTEKPIIVTAPYYGSPFIEFAHYNGFIMSDHLKGFYSAYLKEKYPNYYNCLDWSAKFYHWDEFVDFEDILKKVKSSFYVYIGIGKSGDLAGIEKRIGAALDLDKAITRILYRDPDSGEQLIEIIVNP